MMPDTNQAAEKSRPFPWHCIECGKEAIFPISTDYTATVKHDGRSYSVRIPDLSLPTCRNCGAQVFTGAEDERIRAGLRFQLRLLTPQEIFEHRQRLRLNQQELAEHLGVAKETISRWETGALMQSRAMDNLLRLYFKSEEVRALLAQNFNSPSTKRIQWTYVKEERYEKVSFDLSRN